MTYNKAYTFYLDQAVVDKGRGLVGHNRPYASLSDLMRVALEHELDQYTDAQAAHWEYVPPESDVSHRVYEPNVVPATKLGPPMEPVTIEEYKGAEAIYDEYLNGDRTIDDVDVSSASDTMERYLREQKLM